MLAGTAVRLQRVETLLGDDLGVLKAKGMPRSRKVLKDDLGAAGVAVEQR